MKISQKQTVDITVGIICDICGNKQSEHQTFSIIKYHGGGWQGVRDYKGEIEVCSCKCFIEALKRLKCNWESIDSVVNCKILQDTVGKLDDDKGGQ